MAATWTPEHSWRPVLVLERAAADALRRAGGPAHIPWSRLRYCAHPAELGDALAHRDAIAVLDPVGRARPLCFGEPGADDARGALAALDAGFELVASGQGDALVTAPLGKKIIAETLDPSFRGHTDYLARRAGLERYGRDYLMTFLAPELRVALLSTHVSLREALLQVSAESIQAAVRCLGRSVPRGRACKIAVAGLNPHAGERGLMGSEENESVRPAIAVLRAEGFDVHGPESPDTVFVRARQGEFDWVLALYHDQGLIAVKTAGFGQATNWTLGLPIVRTSVDHGTAYALAGRWRADVGPMRAVVETTLELLRARAAGP